MGGELQNLVLDWSIALASLLYSHGVGMFIAQGTTRFLALFPVIYLFVSLPLNLYSMFCVGPTSFFMSWLGSFKLMLYAFGQGPLSSHPSLPLSHFISTACLPINITRNQKHPSRKITKKSPKDYTPRVLLFIIAIKMFDFKDHLHPILVTCLYAYYLFFILELLLAIAGWFARITVGVEIEPQFDEPHHATSVQNFWGKRWNLMVSGILRPTVYQPARTIFSYLVPERWVSVPAIFSTFLVSGIMHEMIFYYLGRLTPTYEVTWFFIVHGLWVGTEVVVKKTMDRRFDPPPAVTRPLTLTFVILTSFWLFFPPLLRIDPFGRACREAMAMAGFFKHGQQLSPNEYQCPLM
ncbi:hypothetical protein L6452_19518 [Arctium lappa]|uniref:Uncharacterized protein n=1 Tax=Arctium lappa TaxID=4217 RepID=A0ACB9B8E4_ARCLA|nr:hypothetical protein L6452_19518 [Arctium lappa]